MKLPPEIRLLIYDELLVKGVILCRPKSFSCPKNKMHHWTDSMWVPKLVDTQILRTNKQIYNETVERLYSRNTVQIPCRDCSKTDASESCLDCSKTDVSESCLCWVWPDDLPCVGINSYQYYVKTVAIAYRHLGDTKPDSWFLHFSELWPGIEEQILAHYNNTKHISLKLQSYWTFDTTFDFVRRSSKSSTEPVDDYGNVRALAQKKWYEEVYDFALALTAPKKRYLMIELLDCKWPRKYAPWAMLEEMCDQVVLSSAQGGLKDATFAVQGVRWNPAPMRLKDLVFYLGCDKHSASETLLKSILARQDARKEGTVAGP